VPGPTINGPIVYENCSGATAPNCSGSGVVNEYFQTDHHGSVIAMSGASGTSAEGPYLYDGYGSGAPLTGVPFKFVGMYLDGETGLYYDRARYYSPALGRFLQTDPVGYKDDLDLYTYVGNDPTDKADPTGKSTVSVGLDVGAATPWIGGSYEVGFVVAFGDVPLDVGAYQATSSIKGAYLSVGPDVGGTVRGGIEDMKGQSKTTTYALGLAVTKQEPLDHGPTSVSTDAGTGKGLEVPKGGKVQLEAVKGKMHLQFRPKEGVAVGYAKGTTDTKSFSVNSAMQKLETAVRNWLTRQSE
jgi:RHS repeat-associated protein